MPPRGPGLGGPRGRSIGNQYRGGLPGSSRLPRQEVSARWPSGRMPGTSPGPRLLATPMPSPLPRQTSTAGLQWLPSQRSQGRRVLVGPHHNPEVPIRRIIRYSVSHWAHDGHRTARVVHTFPTDRSQPPATEPTEPSRAHDKQVGAIARLDQSRGSQSAMCFAHGSDLWSDLAAHPADPCRR